MIEFFFRFLYKYCIHCIYFIQNFSKHDWKRMELEQLYIFSRKIYSSLQPFPPQRTAAAACTQHVNRVKVRGFLAHFLRAEILRTLNFLAHNFPPDNMYPPSRLPPRDPSIPRGPLFSMQTGTQRRDSVGGGQTVKYLRWRRE